MSWKYDNNYSKMTLSKRELQEAKNSSKNWRHYLLFLQGVIKNMLTLLMYWKLLWMNTESQFRLEKKKTLVNLIRRFLPEYKKVFIIKSILLWHRNRISQILLNCKLMKAISHKWVRMTFRIHQLLAKKVVTLKCSTKIVNIQLRISWNLKAASLL